MGDWSGEFLSTVLSTFFLMAFIAKDATFLEFFVSSF